MSVKPAEYEIGVYGADAYPLGRLSGITSGSLIPRYNDVGTWAITIPTDNVPNGLIEPGNGIYVRRNGEVDPIISGPIDGIDDVDLGGDNQTNLAPAHLIINGYSEEIRVAAKLAWPNPTGAPNAGLPRDSRSGAMETVLKGFVRDNTVESETGVLRGVPYMVVSADQGRGDTSGFSARFDNLLLVLQTVSRYVPGSGVSAGLSTMGFTLTWSPGQFLFEVQPKDITETPSRVFSRGRGNLGGREFKINAPTATYVIAGGTGQGTDRALFWQQNIPTRTRWGYHKEQWLDMRGQTDAGQIADSMASALAQGDETYSLAADLLDTPALQYGKDYTLGDRVRVYPTEDYYIDDIITQVTYDLAENAVTEMITPTVGDWQAQKATAVERAVKKLIQRVGSLETI